MPVLTQEKRGGIVGPPNWPGGHGDGPDDSTSSFPLTKGQIGLWILLAAVTMLFAGLSSAYIVLRGVPTWQNIVMPAVLWFNTIVLVASSITIELSRRALRNRGTDAMKTWVVISAVLGLGFLTGQIVAYRQLAEAGVYLSSTLHSGFFYVLTSIHGIHLLGGVIAMAAVLARALRNRITPANDEPLRLCATYWHFMDGLWLYLFLLLVLA